MNLSMNRVSVRDDDSSTVLVPAAVELVGEEDVDAGTATVQQPVRSRLLDCTRRSSSVKNAMKSVT